MSISIKFIIQIIAAASATIMLAGGLTLLIVGDVRSANAWIPIIISIIIYLFDAVFSHYHED